MKILFLIGYPPKFEAKNWKEILKYSKNSLAFDEEFYQIIKDLELNEEFEKEVVKSRKRLGIPEAGYSWQEYGKMSDHKRDDLTDDEMDRMLFLLKNYPNEVKRISRKLKLNKRILDELKDIILTSSVTSPDYLSDIHYWIEPDDRYELMDEDEKEEAKEITKSFNIAFLRQVSKNELIKFIERNWDYIEKRTKLLPRKTNHYISKRDLRIVQLRDKDKLTFNEIVSQVAKEFDIDDPFGKTNEDSVKTAYRRAKLKISSLVGNPQRDK